MTPPRLVRWLADVFADQLWCPECQRWRPMSINGWRCDGCAAAAMIDALLADIELRQSMLLLQASMQAAASHYADYRRRQK